MMMGSNQPSNGARSRVGSAITLATVTICCICINRRCDALQTRLAFHTTGWLNYGNRRTSMSPSSNSSPIIDLQPLIQTVLYAKKTKNGKKKETNSDNTISGGFGKATATTAQKTPNNNKKTTANKPLDQDYSVFPMLDPQVADTLITSPPSLSREADLLPIEIYDRLDQIYGFPNFNYEQKPSARQVDKEDLPSDVSFTDLLAATPSTTKPSDSILDNVSSQQSSTLSDTDFADLLAVATGGDSNDLSSKISSSSTRIDVGKNTEDDGDVMSTQMNDAISQLPPFDRFRVLHVDPLVLAIDDFFTDDECDRYVEMSLTPTKLEQQDGDTTSEGHKAAALETKSKTVGKDAAAKSQRTSTTWFHHYERVPELMAKASRLIGLDGITHWEEPQTVRYRRNEKFTWHLDALSPLESTPDQGGQRTATLLVYLKGMSEGSGGATVFRDLTDGSGSNYDADDRTFRREPLKV
jgi:hypothetical protein